MANLSYNPARVALLTAMAESTDHGAKVWDEQPATRNSTKRALLESGFVKVTKGKAGITAEGRAALTGLTLKEMAAPEAPKAEAPSKGDAAKAKFEAARAEVVKPNGNGKRKTAEAAPTKADLTAALKSDEFAKAVTAQPAANPPEKKAGKQPSALTTSQREQVKADWEKVQETVAALSGKAPAQQAEQPAPEAPKEEAKDDADPRGSKLAAIIQDVYGVTFLEAPALALIWAASQLADLEGIEAAKTELSYCNWRRERAGKVPAYPPYGSKLF